jgi:hypothetical protein
MGRLTFLTRRLPPRFEVALVTIAPGRERTFDPTEWADALVVVERGEIELECAHGGPLRFVAGELLWLCGLGARTLRNPGSRPAPIAAVRRTRGRGQGQRGMAVHLAGGRPVRAA